MNESPAAPVSPSRVGASQAAGTRLGPAQQLEDLWRHGEQPDVQDFIRRQAIQAPSQLVAVLCVDQWRRWHAGEIKNPDRSDVLRVLFLLGLA